ncbi:hypothetical protein VNO80_17695 [Phaseolus coccineus]|uniref:Uncharacterized protein n=1 Tax=Phaseolus coccineus TaxID=3886 RepID=A0AAN9MCF7_PHACN
MMAVAQSHVPTCRVMSIQESYRYDDMEELGMDQTDASKKGNRTFQYTQSLGVFSAANDGSFSIFPSMTVHGRDAGE